MPSRADSNARFPIAVKVWAGDDPRDFDYVSRSLPSLLASDLPSTADVVVFNDRSTDTRLKPFLEKLQSSDPRVRVIEHEFNKGPNLGQADAFERLTDEYADAAFFVSVDDDAVYHRDWFRRTITAMDDVQAVGVNGVFTSFNTPFRKSHTELDAGGSRYQLKWKQPATNWLLPREVFEHVGPFRDEGIAFDTVYSHRMRLLGYSVVCPTKSYVQDLWLSGAYAVDNRLCADRFLGEGTGDPWWKRGATWSRYHLSRVVRELRAARHRQPEILWPARWGTDWLYEAVGENQEPVALWSVEEDVNRGWSGADVSTRAREILAMQLDGPFALKRVHYSRHGQPTLVESGWQALPTLREAAELFSEQLPASSDLLCAIAQQLVPFHRSGVAHGKVRPENIFFDPATRAIHLAWLGPEAPQTGFDPADRVQCRELFGSSVDRRCRESVRDEHAARVVNILAPEFLTGSRASIAGDIYAAAASVRAVRDQDREHEDFRTSDTIEDCLVATAELRVPNAVKLLEQLRSPAPVTSSVGVFQ